MYEYEQAGMTAIHLEDQVGPKRCGHMSGKSAIAVEDMVAKLSAAVDARADPDFVLIAAPMHLLLKAWTRRSCARRYAEAGADVLWIEAPENERGLEKISA
jgi:2-methylisocitrate lyase-like PEP mutase family enzyme